MDYQIDIDGEISPWGYNHRYVAECLRKHKNKHVDVRINSLGGSVAEALAMATLFKEHDDCTAYLTGLVASAATVASLGCKKIVMNQDGAYLAHQVSSWVEAWGRMNAEEIKEAIVQLEKEKKDNEKFDLILARMYAKKSGKPVNEILDVMKKAEWLLPEEALNLGFIDEITNKQIKNDVVISNEKLNAYNLPMFNQRKSSIIDRVSNFFGLNENNQNKINNNQMAKTITFAAMGSLLKVTAFELNDDNKSLLTNEQLSLINSELEKLQKSNSDHETKIKELEALIADKDAQIENLKKGPGAETSEMVQNANPAQDKSDFENKSAQDIFEAIKNLI